ncbi:hypothetical protein MGU_09559 [Metarhizium guizhouense ARSEF 977]|uniref:Uncharacterized protein n=1 Tax=Metarhizium guizhouense (strain ARSEF 977) TaxID=1276136 RepID=A0A0B4GKR0_METGA|nr:hypothetical protein MGU_09559 [Metarhizium guizhouense ARSEF 977]
MPPSNPTSAQVQGSGCPESETSSSARFHHRTVGIECPPQLLVCVEQTRHERCGSCRISQGLEQLGIKFPTHVLAKVLDSSKGKLPWRDSLESCVRNLAPN